jgi:hypothetical protein
VLPATAGTEGGGEPTTLANAGVDVGAVVVHHPVLRRSTIGRSCHSLPLLGYLVSMDCIVCGDGIADQPGNVPPVLSTLHSCSLVGRPIMKRSFFFSSVSTRSGTYYARWLNNLEQSYMDLPPCFRSMNSWHFFLIMAARL